MVKLYNLRVVKVMVTETKHGTQTLTQHHLLEVKVVQRRSILTNVLPGVNGLPDLTITFKLSMRQEVTGKRHVSY